MAARTNQAALPDTPLIQELKSLIRTGRSIEAGTLLRYPCVVGSPLVLRTLGGVRGPMEQAKVASDCIRAAIAAIPGEGLRQIAEATFCVGKYEGLLVKERQQKLWADHTIGKDAYKSRRNLIVGHVAAYLSAAPPAQFDQQPRAAAPIDADGPMVIGMCAINLAFACLAAMCIESLKVIYGSNDAGQRLRTYQTQALEARDAASRRIFEAYNMFSFACVAFYMSSTFAVGGLPPVAAEQFTEGCWRLVSDLGPRIDAQSRLSSSSGKMPTETGWWEFFQDWGSEHRDQRHVGEISAPLLEPVALEALRVGGIVADTVGFDQPYAAMARARAHKVVAYYFDFDEWHPFGAGGSLRSRADAFFDQYLLRSRLSTQS